MIGTRLGGRYEVVGELGRGGMGMVFRAKDPHLSRDVAVKLLPSTAVTAEGEERFRREAQLVAQMDHPAIVPIHDIGKHEGALFFVMPVVQGTSLRIYLKERTLRLGDVVDVGIEVAEALEYSHERGVVHRDIKPENIMVARAERELRVRVMDFGLAVKPSDDRVTRSGSVVGTVAYLSPEQVGARPIDGRTDIYSLGTVLYECLIGEPPFAGDLQSILYRIVHDNPRSPRALDPDVDEELGELVLRCLSKDPLRRPQTAGEVADALRRYKTRLGEAEREKFVGASSVFTLDLRRPALPRFVGREREFAALQDSLNLATGGECQLALVSGEPGIGKTRLLTELETLARARKIRVLKGRFAEIDRAAPYQGFCELIQEHFLQRDATSGERPDLNDLASELAALFPALAEIPELRTSLAGASRTSLVETHRPEDKREVFELLARTLARIGGTRPLVLVLENLHRAEVSLEAVEYIVRRLGPTPTLVAGSYRSTEVDKRHPLTRMLAAWSDDPRFSWIPLGPLTREEHADLLQTLLGDGNYAAGLTERLYQATEGNPFFAKELVRSLVDSGGIAKTDGVWALSGVGLSADALPATIQQAVENRVARFPQALSETLAIAAVLGRTFDLRSLAEATGGDVEDALDQLVAQGILDEDRAGRGDRFTFQSAIVRDVLYASLPRRKRKAIHKKHAEALEKRHAGRPERVAQELLYHFSQGDVPEKSVEYGLRAGRAALAAFSPDDAVRAAKTALDFLADESWEGDRAVEADARLLFARALRMEGSVDAAIHQAERALKVREEAGDRAGAAEALLFLTELAWETRRTEESRRYGERGVEHARAAGMRDELLRLLSITATVATLAGEDARAKELLEEAERLARPPEAPGAREMPRGGTLSVAFANPVAALDPSTIELVEEEEVLSSVFETLAQADALGNTVPHLAESWEVREGGRSVVVQLRKNARFHDGAALQAADVKRALERAFVKSLEPPAALAALEGAAELASGAAGELAGLRVLSPESLEFRLTEPLPIFPALLTDMRIAIAKDDGGLLVGTGPFRIESSSSAHVHLERSPYPRGAAPYLDAIEFKTGVAPSAIAIGLRSGEFDVVRDLQPEDLEQVLREVRLRSGLVEAAKKNTSFVLFNTRSPLGGNAQVRRALARVLSTPDLVLRTCGRFAQVATGLLPPGILGHDAGRRQKPLTKERALEVLGKSGVELPATLTVAAHPAFLGRYAAMLDAIVEIWAELGLKVAIANADMDSFLQTAAETSGVDVRLGRWIADYDDPDGFSHALFHSTQGRFRAWFSSKESDDLLEAARAETRPHAREGLYRRHEELLLSSDVVAPLFHEIDYRIAGPKVRGLKLRSISPPILYAEVAKVERAPVASARATAGGILHVPIAAELSSLDPAYSATVEQGEVLPCVFESLTRVVEGARVMPWLAREVVAEDGGRRFKFTLRDDVRFHDGRRLTSRDVRWSFERLLQSATSEARWRLSPILGARRLAAGEAASLEGLRIASATELVVDLEAPTPFFPALLADSAAAIVPEGTERFTGTWHEHCAGSGPFRVVRFEPGVRLELERNPIYWREGLPKADALVFHLGLAPDEVLARFRAGELSLASDLLPRDVEELRHEAPFAASYREIPFLSTYFVAFNVHEPPLDDIALRRLLAHTVDVEGVVKRALGRLAVPATGLIPPGLLGSDRVRDQTGPRSSAPVRPAIVSETHDLSAVVNPIFFNQYASLTAELYSAFKSRGARVHPVNRTWAEFNDARANATTHLYVGRGVADYPDPDCFAHGILHSKEGTIGRFCGSEELDGLILRARAESDPSLRHSLYRAIEEKIAKDALVMPLFHEQVYRFARPEVEGLDITFSTPPVVAYEKVWVRR